MRLVLRTLGREDGGGLMVRMLLLMDVGCMVVGRRGDRWSAGARLWLIMGVGPVRVLRVLHHPSEIATVNERLDGYGRSLSPQRVPVVQRPTRWSISALQSSRFQVPFTSESRELW